MVLDEGDQTLGSGGPELCDGLVYGGERRAHHPSYRQIVDLSPVTSPRSFRPA